jgi:uncharacterized membrane protein HdeD (DUF308 family)
MRNSFYRFWWILSLAGVLLISLGVAIFTNPDFNKVLFIKQSGLMLAISGLLYAIFYYLIYKAQPGKNIKPYVLSGSIFILGVVIALFAQSLAVVLHYLLSFYALWLGVLQLVIAARGEGKALFSWVSGGLSFLIGILLIWNPDFMELGYLIGAYAVMLGIWLIFRGLKLRL